MRASHEAHVASLVDAHQAEVAQLKSYLDILEEQQSQRTLHHGMFHHRHLLVTITAFTASLLPRPSWSFPLPSLRLPHLIEGISAYSAVTLFV